MLATVAVIKGKDCTQVQPALLVSKRAQEGHTVPITEAHESSPPLGPLSDHTLPAPNSISMSKAGCDIHVAVS